jgi:hypothetical protein
VETAYDDFLYVIRRFKNLCQWFVVLRAAIYAPVSAINASTLEKPASYSLVRTTALVIAEAGCQATRIWPLVFSRTSQPTGKPRIGYVLLQAVVDHLRKLTAVEHKIPPFGVEGRRRLGGNNFFQ